MSGKAPHRYHATDRGNTIFTGLVEQLAQVVQLRPEGPGVRLIVGCDEIAPATEIGDSIAVNGCCLTVVECDQHCIHFEAGPETLQRTNLGQLTSEGSVNLERSLRVGDRLGGHFVSGHIDCVGTCIERDDQEEWSFLRFRVPRSWTRQMVAKGSVAVDGVSLTIIDVDTDSFNVMLIPHTLSVTTLGAAQSGTLVNIETDLLAKYVEKSLGHEDASVPAIE